MTRPSFGILLASLLLYSLPFANAQQTDEFAKIGGRAYTYRAEGLKENLPPALPEKMLPLSALNRQAVFRPMDRMDTPAEMEKMLDSLRSAYQPFMQNLAPPFADMREKIRLETFRWRVETPEDRQDFSRITALKGQWAEVKIPHYGPPLGKAATYYVTSFKATSPTPGKAAFIRFKGVDYIAEVFINGAFAGRHEGFFAPFEFDISALIRPGENQVVVRVENDYVMAGNKDEQGRKYLGDKIYASTGLGYDEPMLGWHHCPPGMGIYQEVWIEYRSQLHIADVFVRPLPKQQKAEVQVEVGQTFAGKTTIRLEYSIFGRNFQDTVVMGATYVPATRYVPGVGDMPKPSDWAEAPLLMGRGPNFLKFEVPMPDARLWNPSSPWLYQVQVAVKNEAGQTLDRFQTHFGMRSFRMDTTSVPKGRMYLNGQPIRLRGANTMGHMQNAVLRKDFNRLRDDILLAKVANMNFYRLTQRPVQPEIYEYMDMLGMMAQTDLPMFGVVRRNQVPEILRQAAEMERLVRNHPCNIVISYLNERFPNAEGDPHRHLNTPEEFDRLFRALDEVVLLQNPDRVIKHMDGDYDPPGPGLPDNHCYNGWYNGHGLGLGQMHRGHWMPTKPGWLYACGEFGAEGLDNLPVMQKYYPKEWLPASAAAEKSWVPILHGTQTARFYPMWFGKQKSVNNWIQASQEHQARVIRMTADALRRDPNMVSFAVHLFIDAWPNGWIKTLMDVDRQPKKAFYEYREALEPLTVNLRSDRSQFWSAEKVRIEAWAFNDLNQAPSGCSLVYQLENSAGKVLLADSAPADLPINSSQFQGFISFGLPVVQKRSTFVLRLGLRNQQGRLIAEHHLPLEVFPGQTSPATALTIWAADDYPQAEELLRQAGIPYRKAAMQQAGLLLLRPADYQQHQAEIDRLVANGAKAVLSHWEEGEYQIAGSNVRIFRPAMGSYYFTEPLPHPYTDGLAEQHFRNWFHRENSYFMPLLDRIMTGEGWTPVLMSGNADWSGTFEEAFTVAEKKTGKGAFVLSQLHWQERLQDNPAARQFWMRVLTTQR